MTRWAFWSVVTRLYKGIHQTQNDVASANLSYGRGDGGVCSEHLLKGHHSRLYTVLLTLRPPMILCKGLLAVLFNQQEGSYVMENSINKAVIYTRVTDKDNDAFTLSQEEQTSFCKVYAAEHEMEVIEIYHDYGPSGFEIIRPALTDMLQMIATEQNMHVLVASSDRFGRDILVMANIHHTIQLLGAKVIDVSAETREARRVV